MGRVTHKATRANRGRDRRSFERRPARRVRAELLPGRRPHARRRGRCGVPRDLERAASRRIERSRVRLHGARMCSSRLRAPLVAATFCTFAARAAFGQELARSPDPLPTTTAEPSQPANAPALNAPAAAPLSMPEPGPSKKTYPAVGGHFGMALPIATFGTSTTVLGSDFVTLGLTPGITVHLDDDWAVDFEFIALNELKNTPAQRRRSSSTRASSASSGIGTRVCASPRRWAPRRTAGSSPSWSCPSSSASACRGSSSSTRRSFFATAARRSTATRRSCSRRASASERELLVGQGIVTSWSSRMSAPSAGYRYSTDSASSRRHAGRRCDRAGCTRSVAPRPRCASRP